MISISTVIVSSEKNASMIAGSTAQRAPRGEQAVKYRRMRMHFSISPSLWMYCSIVSDRHGMTADRSMRRIRYATLSTLHARRAAPPSSSRSNRHSTAR